MDEFEQWFADQDFYTNMRFIHGDNLFSKDGDVYRVLPVQMVYKAYQEKPKPPLGKPFNFDLLDSHKEKIEQLEKENAHLAEMNKRYLGKMQEQQDQISELKKDLCAHKIEHFEMYGRISYAHHCFVSMSRDHFYKNIEAIICGRLRHPEFSFDKTQIKALRGECG